MKCNVQPYGGQDAFVFLSYAMGDEGIAFPLIERMARQGVRVWYAPYDMEASTWVTQTREKLRQCTAFAALMTEASVFSRTCRSQLTGAVEQKKPQAVFIAGGAALTPAVRLQIGCGASFSYGSVPQENEVNAFIGAQQLAACKSLPDARVKVQDFSLAQGNWAVESEDGPGESTMRDMLLRDRRSIHGEKKAEEAAETHAQTVNSGEPAEKAAPAETAAAGEPMPAEKTEHATSAAPIETAPAKETEPVKPAPAEKNEPAGRPEKAVARVVEQIVPEEDGEETVKPTRFAPAKQLEDKLDETVVPAPSPLPLIISMRTGETHRGRIGDTVIGRRRMNSEADVDFGERSRLFSNQHLRLICIDEARRLVMLHLNGATVNGEDYEKDQVAPLEAINEIVIPNRRTLAQYAPGEVETVILTAVLGEEARTVRTSGMLAGLHSVETGETKYLLGGEMLLGKHYPWKSGAMRAATISRKHATIAEKDGAYTVQVHSLNGLYLNGELLEQGEVRQLGSGDTLRFEGNTELGIPDEHFIFRCTALKED